MCHCHVSPPPQYVVQCHGSTLLPRFLGMYRVSVDSEETYLLVMRNMFSHRLPVHRKYDLKVMACPPPNPGAPPLAEGGRRTPSLPHVASGFPPPPLFRAPSCPVRPATRRRYQGGV